MFCYILEDQCQTKSFGLDYAAAGSLDATTFKAIEVAFWIFVVLREALLKAYPSLTSGAAGSPFIHIQIRLSKDDGLDHVSGRSIAFPALRKSFLPSPEHMHF